jgi:hypothetical protein
VRLPSQRQHVYTEIVRVVRWAAKERDGALRQQVQTDSHSPDRADTGTEPRPMVPAFDVQPGEALYLTSAERVRICRLRLPLTRSPDVTQLVGYPSYTYGMGVRL